MSDIVPPAADSGKSRTAGDAQHNHIDGQINWLSMGAEAFYNGTADWMRGAAQLSNHVLGTDWQAPEKYTLPEPTSPAQWLAKSLGSGLAVVAPYVATELTTRAAAALRLLPALTGASKAAIDGGLYGMVFTPSDDAHQSFAWQRFAGTATGMATFGSQRYAFDRLAGSLGLLENRAFARSWRGIATRVGVNAASGAGAGFVNTETSSWLSGNGLVFDGRLVDNMANYAATGLALDGVHIGASKLLEGAGSSPHFAPAREAAKAAIRGNTERLNRLIDGAGNMTAATFGIDAFMPRLLMAGSAPGHLAIDHIMLSQALDNNGGAGARAGRTTHGGTPIAFQDASGAQRLQALENSRAELLSVLSRPGAPKNQDAVWKALDRALKEPATTARGGRNLHEEGWRVFATVPQSGLDAVGADYLLVNVNTGATHFLDASADSAKGSATRPVPAIREQAVIYFDPRTFELGSQAITNWVNETQSQLLGLADSAAPFNIHTTPLPNFRVVPGSELVRHLNVFIDWLKQQPAESYQDYANDLSNGTLFYAKGAAGEFKSEAFNMNAMLAAEKAIATWLARKYGTSPPELLSDAGPSERKTELAIVRNEVQGTRRLVMRMADGRQTQVDMPRLMGSARSQLIHDLSVTDRQLDAMEPGRTRKRILSLRRLFRDAGISIDSVRARLTSDRGDIEAGGSGNFSVTPEIALTTRRILERRTEDSLLGRNTGSAGPKPEKPVLPLESALGKALPELAKMGKDFGLNWSNAEELATALSMLVEQDIAQWSDEESTALQQLIKSYEAANPYAVARVKKLAGDLAKGQ